jgi:DNA-binding IclR family transcriptional regulator
MMADETVGDRYLVPGLVRGLTALKLFTPERSALTLAEIARALGISRSAAFRTVYTLTEMGCMLHDADLSETELVSLFRLDAAGLSKGRSPALPAILSRAAQDRQTEAVVHAGDFEAGIVSAAAPVRDMTGRVIAAINVTAPHTPDALADLDSDVRDVLVATAGRISRMLGWDGSMQTAKAS